MRNETRELFNAFCENIAEMNMVGTVATRFNVDPTVQQRLVDRKHESQEFLNKVNFITVPEMEAKKVGLGIGSPITSNTDTSQPDARREPKDPTGLDEFGYRCRKNNQDTKLDYDKLDMWAKFKDFELRIQNHIVQRQALDTIMIGFNGTSWAADSDLVANPNLEDVNLGWLQNLRTDKSTHVLDEVAGGVEAGKVTYGPAGDYSTLDALVYDAVNAMLPSWARNDTGLTCFVSWDLLDDKYFPLINQAIDPTEQMARDTIMSTKRLGRRPAETPPYMPQGTIFVTRHDNLSVYEQEGKRRRHVKDEPEYDRVVDYQSSNDAYVIEDYDFACLIENVEYKAA